MRRRYLFLIIASLPCLTAFSQETKPAIISGMVKDARTKLPLNEAVITLSSTSFKGEKYALTDSAGKYRVNNLPGGIYTISFEMEGYRKFSRDSIVVSPGMSLGASFEMVLERKSMAPAKERAKGNPL